jgi:hypothetical protein
MAKCFSCDKRCNAVNDLCRGCGEVVCADCAATYGHELGGGHGVRPTKRPSDCANVSEIEVICPNCNLVFDVPVPGSHGG